MSVECASAIVLCGGRSSRMGMDKANLPFGAETLLERVVRICSEAVDRVVVVASPEQLLPPLPSTVRIVHDRESGRGPLEGLRTGLAAIEAPDGVAYLT